jgi:sentrin-specific protease 1
MRKLKVEEKDTVKRALSPGALLPSSLNQKDLSTLAGRKGEEKLNTNIINMYTQVVLKQCDKKLCLQEQERRQSLFYGSEFIDKYFDKTNIGSYHYEQVIRYSKMAPDGDIFKSKYIFFLIHSVKHFELAVVFVEEKMICNYDPLLVTTRTRNKCVHKTDIQETKLKGFLQYLKDEHVDKKGFEMPNAKKWELKSMDKNDIPQQENVSDCGVFICMFCDYILNGCKLNFKQDDIMEGSWRQKMILSILTTCGDNDNDTYKEGMEYESDNDMEVIIQPTKKTKGKRSEIIDELIWTQATKVIAKRIQNSAGKQCKENSDCYVECDDDCTSGEQCTNKRIQNKMWKSVVKKMTENGKEYGLFVKEDCKIGDLIIEYVGKVVQTEKNNQQHILHENKWSTDMDQRNKHGSIGKVHQSLMRPKLQTRTVGSQRITKNVLFCKQRNQGGSRTDL